MLRGRKHESNYTRTNASSIRKSLFTRYYDPNKKISQEDFAAILEFARLSPSSVGSDPWKFLVIQNKALRDKLKPFSWGMQYQLDDCSHLVIILAKKMLDMIRLSSVMWRCVKVYKVSS